MFKIRSFGCRDACCQPNKSSKSSFGLSLAELGLEASEEELFFNPLHPVVTATAVPGKEESPSTAASSSPRSAKLLSRMVSRSSSCSDLSAYDETEASDPGPGTASQGCSKSGCCCGAGYSINKELLAHRALESTGLLRVAKALGGSSIGSIISILFFFAAGIMSLHLGQCLCSPARKVFYSFLGMTYLISGLPNMVQALAQAAAGRITVHVLLVCSSLGTLAMGMPIEGALLLLLFHISHVLESIFTSRAHGHLEQLLEGTPDMATVVSLAEKGGPIMLSAKDCKTADVQPGQYVLVKPGEQVPLDGVVEWGSASVSSAHISGEVIPHHIVPGSQVPAGSLNCDGLLVVKVTAAADCSTPAQMVKLAQAAKASKPQLQRLLDQVGDVWSKTVVIATVLTVAGLLLAGVPLLGRDGALYRAIGVLTAGSPCALYLAPLAYACALSTATRKGVLVKSAGAFDTLHQCKTVALDKTGTVTTGKLVLTDVMTWQHAEAEEDAPASPPAPGWNKLPLSLNGAALPSAGPLQYAAALASASTHPVSVALSEGLTEAQAGHGDDKQCAASKVVQLPGSGVQGICQGVQLPEVSARLGSLEYVLQLIPADGGTREKLALSLSACTQLHSSPKAVTYMLTTPVRSPDEPAAVQEGSPFSLVMFCLDDSLQAGVKESVADLRTGAWKGGVAMQQLQKEVVMLTGDNEGIARHISLQAGIDNFKAAMKPEDKLDFIKEATTPRARGGLLMMGDGINDAPALAGADVGVAVASALGNSVATAADIIVLNGHGVANLPWLFRLSDSLKMVVQQNVLLSLAAMMIAAIPTMAGFFPLWMTVLLHEGSTVLVALNSLRLLRDPEVGAMCLVATVCKGVTEKIQGNVFHTKSE